MIGAFPSQDSLYCDTVLLDDENPELALFYNTSPSRVTQPDALNAP